LPLLGNGLRPAVPTTKTKMMKKKRIIAYSIAVVVLMGLAGAYYGYREFNRTNKSLTEISPAFVLHDADLAKLFESNEDSALHLFAGKVLQVDGLVRKVESGDNGPTVVVLGEADAAASLRVEMDSLLAPAALLLEIGKQATLRAVCTGYSGDDLGLGADILMNRGVIVKQQPSKN
jgi:tRNA_anti-like